MSTPARTITFGGDRMWVHLADGRVLAAPLAGFPCLLAATPQERARFTLSPRSLADFTHGRAATPA